MPAFGADRLVLVTGGTGFVGSHFVEELQRRGARVRIPIHRRPLRCHDPGIEAVPADLTSQADCLRVCQGVDVVVHAAGAVAGSGVTGGAAVLAAISENLTLTARVLQAAAACQVERFLLFSSSTGYPVTEGPAEETQFWSGPPHPAYFGYGWMRRYLERLGEFVQQCSKTRVAIVRPTAIYGERDNFALGTSHVIPALIRRAVAGEDPFVVWGHPGVRRDFLHVRDLVAGSLLLLEKHPDCDPVNIGCGESVTVQDLVEMVLAAVGHQPKVEFSPAAATTVPSRRVDIGKAKRLLGFAPATTLRCGLQQTVDWYRRTHTGSGGD